MRCPARRTQRVLPPHPVAATMKTLRDISTAAVLLLFLTGLAWAQRWPQRGGWAGRDDGFPRPGGAGGDSGSWFWSTTRRAQQPQRTTPTPSASSTQSTPSPQQLVDARGHPVNCPCPSTEEHNPVCGSNGATYNNPGKLRCAQRCGYEVELAFYGNCDPLLG